MQGRLDGVWSGLCVPLTKEHPPEMIQGTNPKLRSPREAAAPLRGRGVGKIRE
jgi:hypothetical protein